MDNNSLRFNRVSNAVNPTRSEFKDGDDGLKSLVGKNGTIKIGDGSSEKNYKVTWNNGIANVQRQGRGVFRSIFAGLWSSMKYLFCRDGLDRSGSNAYRLQVRLNYLADEQREGSSGLASYQRALLRCVPSASGELRSHISQLTLEDHDKIFKESVRRSAREGIILPGAKDVLNDPEAIMLSSPMDKTVAKVLEDHMEDPRLLTEAGSDLVQRTDDVNDNAKL